ncbi:MAG: hypothetical protein RL096_125 [Actinomycetota bacterium]
MQLAGIPAPTAVTAVPISGETTKLLVRFNSSANATGYKIQYYKTSDPANYTIISGALAGQDNIITGLDAATSYGVKVAAIQTGNIYLGAQSGWTTAVTSSTYDVTATPALTYPNGKTRTVSYGATANFDVTASAADSGVLTYQWQISTDSGTNWANVSAGTGATIDAYDAGVLPVSASGNNYRVIVTNTKNGMSTPVTSDTFTLSVNKATPTLATIANVSKTWGEAAFTLPTSTVSPALNGTWSYTSANTGIATTSGTQATLVAAGSSDIIATFSPSDSANYNTASTTFNLTVAKAQLEQPLPAATVVSNTALKVSFAAVANATSYSILMYSASSGGSPSRQVLNATASTDYNFTSLAPATTYYFVVKAYGAGNYSNAPDTTRTPGTTLASNFTVTWDTVGGSSTTATSFAYGANIMPYGGANPTKAGFALTGWALSPGALEVDAITFPYTPATNANTTLYAIWAPLPTAVDFTYRVNNGPSTTISVTPGALRYVQLEVGAGSTITRSISVTTTAGGTATYMLNHAIESQLPWLSDATSSSFTTPPLAALTGTTKQYFETIGINSTVYGTHSAWTNVTLEVTVSPTLTLTSANRTATVGTPFTYTPTVAGGKSGYSYALTGTLPAGLTFDATDGKVSGTPTANETKSITIDVTDALGTTTSTNYSIAVAKMSQSISVSNSTATFGTNSTLMATGFIGSGAISFDWVSGPCSITAPNTLVSTGAGDCVVTATIAADATHLSQTSVPKTITVGKSGQTISVVSTAATYGTNSTLTTSGYSGTGAISYNWVSGPCAITAPNTLVTTAIGTCVVTATISTDANYLNATSSQQSITISAATRTLGFSTTTYALAYGATQQLTATPSVGAGTVTYDDGSSTACDVNASTGVLTITAASGTCVVNATVAANGNYTSATTTTPVTVTPGKKSIIVAAWVSRSTQVYGTTQPTVSFTPTGLITGDAIDQVVITYSDGAGYTSTDVPTEVATYTVRPSAAHFTTGTMANYDVTYTDAIYAITQASQSIAFGALASKTFGDVDFTIAATASSGLPVAFTTTTPSICSVSGTSVHMIATGNCTIAANQAGNRNFDAAPTASQTFSIARFALAQMSAPSVHATAGVLKSLQVSWSSATNASGYLVKLYAANGTTLVASINTSGNTETIDASDGVTFVDDTTYRVSVTAVGSGNYADGLESVLATAITNRNYTITYNANLADAGAAPVAGSYITDAAASLIATNSGNLARTGYTFAGWNTVANGTGTDYSANGTATYAANSNLLLYAKWTANGVNVTFDENHGSNPATSTQALVADTAAALNANAFQRTGYTFAGWAESRTGAVAYANNQSITLLVSKVLYAKWTPIDYTVTYSLNGGTGNAPTESVKNIADTFTVKPITGVSRTGYDFAGWTDGTTVYQPAASYTVGSQNIVLTALWNIQVYTIAYDTNGSTSGAASRSSDSFTFGSAAITLPTVGSLVRTGYSFGGWSATLNGTPISGNFSTNANVTLHAIWNPNSYTITYNSNGASGAPARVTDSYTTATAGITLPGVGSMVKPGHTFSGWSTTASGNAATSPFTTTVDRIMYAIWTPISYSVSYDSVDAASTPTETNRTIGDRFNLAAAPVKTGFYFAGWNDGTSTYQAGYSYLVGAANIQLRAVWIQIFDVHYNFNGSPDVAPADSPQLDGATINAIAGPQRRGYTFAGWRDQSNTLIAGGASFTVGLTHFVLNAEWTAIPYTVTYNADGGSSTPTEVNHTIGQSFTVGAAPTKTGYTFGGWSDGTLTYGAGATYTVDNNNVVFTSVWNPIAYRVTYDLALGTSQTPVQANRNIGQTFVLAAAPTRAGYTFVKWSDGTNLFAAGDTYTVASADVVLSATWTATPLHVTYSLAAAPGTSPTETDKTIGNTFALAAEPVWANHDFLGWTDGTSTYAAGSNYTIGANDVTITAVWADTMFTVTYLTGGANGAAPTQSPLAATTSFTLPGAGAMGLAGYTFAGWSDGTNIYQAGATITMSAANMTFTAQWTLIPVVVNPPAPNPGTPTTPPVPTPEERIVKVSVPVDLKYGSDSKVLLEARSTIGAPLTWKTASRACKVTEDGQLTVLGAGKCVIEVSEVTAAGLTRVIEIPVMPRLDIVLKDASEIKPNSATLNAVVAWPGADFKVKFCVTTSEKSTDCVVNTTITITSENASGTESGALSISRAIAGLKAESTYFVHAAIMVDDIQYVSTAMMLKTPVDPAPVVLNPTITSQPIAVNKTQIVWKNSLVGAEHIVKLAGAIVCRSVTDSCVINQLLGPNAKLQVYVSLANGTLSDSFVPKYIIPAKRIAIATMSYPARTIYLSKSQKLVLARYARTMLAKGFTRIVISQVVELRPATNFLMAKRLEATANYLKTVLKGKTLKVVLYRKLAPSAKKPNYSKDVGASARKTIISIR